LTIALGAGAAASGRGTRIAANTNAF